MSPRRTRKAMSATGAAKGTYFDENGKPDEAGAAVIKAVGLYPPGSFVHLQNGETGVVLNRGERANVPTVGSTVRPDGIPYSQPMQRPQALRSLHACRIGSVPRPMVSPGWQVRWCFGDWPRSRRCSLPLRMCVRCRRSSRSSSMHSRTSSIRIAAVC